MSCFKFLVDNANTGLICPKNVFESVVRRFVLVLNCPIQALLLVRLSNKLAISAASKCPSKVISGTKDSVERQGVSRIDQHFLELHSSRLSPEINKPFVLLKFLKMLQAQILKSAQAQAQMPTVYRVDSCLAVLCANTHESTYSSHWSFLSAVNFHNHLLAGVVPPLI